jgi:hypothetical protein
LSRRSVAAGCRCLLAMQGGSERQRDGNGRNRRFY